MVTYLGGSILITIFALGGSILITIFALGGSIVSYNLHVVLQHFNSNRMFVQRFANKGQF